MEVTDGAGVRLGSGVILGRRVDWGSKVWLGRAVRVWVGSTVINACGVEIGAQALIRMVIKESNCLIYFRITLLYEQGAVKQ
jgi:acetyltransferase-like isoleucine patch superfamily enzyme